MSARRRTIISFLLASIIVAAAYASMPSYQIVPHGIMLPKNGSQAPYKGPVTLYTSLDAPLFAEKIGFVSVEYHNATLTPDTETQLIAKAKALAAQAGGNGIILSVGRTTLSTPSPLAASVARGIVLKH